MRILFISTHLYPCKLGGVELFHYHLIHALGKHHRIWVITACETDFSQENIHVMKINPKKLGSQKLSLIYEHTRNIIKVRKKIDVVHVPYMSRSWLYGCYLPVLKRLLRIKYVLSLHGGAMLPWRPRLPHKILFQNAAAIVAVSKALKEEYEKRSGREIEVIPPLLPFRKSAKKKSQLKEKYGFKEEEKVILCLESIKKIKGSDILLDAFLHFGEKFIERNKLRLLYVGDGVMRRELEAKVRKAQFEKHVKFFGNVVHEKIPEIFRLADVFVIPSLFEGTSISLLEAMFNGLPIIGSHIEGIANLISDEETGLLFEKNNSQSLSAKIKKLFDDDALMSELGRRAREYYQESFVFENTVKEQLKIYEQALEKR